MSPLPIHSPGWVPSSIFPQFPTRTPLSSLLLIWVQETRPKKTQMSHKWRRDTTNLHTNHLHKKADLPWRSAPWSHKWDFSSQSSPYQHQTQTYGFHPESSDRCPIFLLQTAEEPRRRRICFKMFAQPLLNLLIYGISDTCPKFQGVPLILLCVPL